MKWLTSILIALLVVGFVAGVLNHMRIIERLRRRHIDTWRRLGSPTLIANNSIDNTRRLRAFIRSGEYRELDDAHLERTIRVGQKIEIGYAIVLVAFAVLFVAALAGH